MFLHELAKRFAERRRIRRDIGKLRRFDDYLLADIGVARRDIRARVSGRL